MSEEKKEALLDTTPLPQEVLDMVLEYSTITTYDALRRVVESGNSGEYYFKPSLEEYGRCFIDVGKFRNLLSRDGFAFHVTLPEGQQEVGEFELCMCTSLISVTLPEGLEQVEMAAFHGCRSLTSVTFPEGLQQVGLEAFYGCTSLTSVTFPEGLQRVGEGAFWGCESLTSVTFPVGLQQVGERAFRGCTSLTSVTLPQGCSYVDQTDDRPSFPPGCTISFKGSGTKRRRVSLKPAFQQLRF